MIHPLLPRVLLALFVPFIAIPAAAQAQPQAEAATVRASAIHNRTVVDAAGHPVGAIRGFEFDAGTGQLLNVLVALGGARDTAARLPLPSPLNFDASPWVVRQNRKQLLAQGEPPPPPAGVRATSELIGSELKDTAGTPIGRIEDLMMSRDGKVRLVIAAFTEAWYPEKGLVAVPWQSFDAEPPNLVAKFSSDHIRPAGSKPRPVAPPAPVKPVADQDLRVASLIGREVQDASGKPLGRLEDLVLDASGRRVQAIVVAAEGRRVAVPLPLTLTKLDDRTVGLESLPANAAAPAADALLASRLLQARLRSPKGDAVGSLRDVVVNLGSGSLRYAVAAFDTSWVGAGMVVAMPVGAVRRNGDGIDIAVDRDVLQNGMMIEEAHWKAATPEQYREYANKYIKGL
jgi:sporulation protein YlmC with PRC-barrel domain